MSVGTGAAPTAIGSAAAMSESERRAERALRPRSGSYVPGLEGVRAIAASLIVVYHAVEVAQNRVSFLTTPALVLDVGVAIFFALSGFLIYRPFASAHATGSAAPRAIPFWWRRALRIFPAYWVALAFFIVIGAVTITGPVDLLVHATLTNVFRPASLFNGIFPAWSLSVEVSFYLLVPVWAWSIRRVGSARARTGGRVPLGVEVGGLAVIVVMAHLFRIFVQNVDWHVGSAELKGISFVWLPTHMDLLAGGMALAVLWTAVVDRGVQIRWLHHLGRHVGACWLAGAAIAMTYAARSEASRSRRATRWDCSSSARSPTSPSLCCWSAPWW